MKTAIIAACLILAGCQSTDNSDVADEIIKAAAQPGKSQYCLTGMGFEFCYHKDRTVYPEE